MPRFAASSARAARRSSFALERTEQAALGEADRNVGSFSSVFGLAGYLAPAGVFGLVLGYLRHRERVLSWTMAALAVVGVIGSYVRTALVAFVAGAAFLAAILTGGRDVPRRARTAAIAMIFVIGGVCYAGAVSVSSRSDLAEQRGGPT